MATGADLVSQARSVLGRPYVYGADGPNTFDCSGLVQWCCDQIGVKGCPRTSEEQFAWVSRVSTPTTGDLIFFMGAEGDPPPGHVGIVVSPGVMIDAPHTGSVVQQANYQENGTGVNQFMGYGSIPGLTMSNSPNPASNPPNTKPSLFGDVGGLVAIVFFVIILLVVGLIILAGLGGAMIFNA